MSDETKQSDANVDDADMAKLLARSIDMREASERGEDVNFNESSTIIQRAEDLLVESKLSSAAYLDAQIVNTNAVMYKNIMESEESRSSDFNPTDFATNLLSYLEGKKGERTIWTTLEDEAVALFNNTGGWSWQLGNFENECVENPAESSKIDETNVVNEPAENLKSSKIDEINVVNEPVQKPKQVQQLNAEDDVERYMEEIMNILVKWEQKHKEHLQFWDLVLHPTSFSQTVENIYYVSHLVKEGLVGLGMDRDQLPTIWTVKKGRAVKGVEEHGTVAVTIDMKQWKDLVEAYEIDEPMVTSRDN